MSISGDNADYEKLFLIEVLVDKVQFLQSSINSLRDVLTVPGNICVTFQFLHFPPLKVCETDFAYIPGKPDFSNIVFKTGKSCLFSLRSFRCPILPLAFDIYVTVEKSNWPQEETEKLSENITLGKTIISLGESFTRLMNENTGQKTEALPPAKIIKDIFDLKDDEGSVIGSVIIFARLSCFGKLIITQFKLKSDDPDLVLFKGTNYPCIFKQSVQQLSGDHEKTLLASSIPQEATISVNESRKERDYNLKTLGETLHGDRGMTLKIPENEIRESWRIQKQTVPYYDDRTQIMQMSAYKSYTTYAVHPDTNYDLDLPLGSVGIKDSQVIFQMQKEKDDGKDKKKTSPVYYRVSATEDGKQNKNTVHIIPEDYTAGDTSSHIPSANDHDIFVLRIGQKSEGSEKKSKLELELRTPKVKEPKPETVSIDTQTESSNQKGSVSGKKRGKSKSGGKKGKKGKK